MKFVVDSAIPFLRGVFEPFAQMVYLPGASITREAVRDADALIVRTRTRCDGALLSGSRVRFVATATIGHDHIAADELAALGVQWISAPGSNASSVLQYVACALLTVASQRGWTLSGRTLGVIGVGHVGSKVARLGAMLGMRVLRNDPPRARNEGENDFVPLSRILAAADVISLHVPLTRDGNERTFHLVDPAFCAALEKTPVILNTSRGEVADSSALLQGLVQGRITAALIDVWENEPHISRELLAAAAIATPHIAGYSLDGKAAATGQVVRAVSQFFSLPLDSFTVTELPLPSDPVIRLDAGSTDEQQMFYQVFCRSYDIKRDDAMLRARPDHFEALREHYPMRREPLAYVVQGGPQGIAWRERLGALGFR